MECEKLGPEHVEVLLDFQSGFPAGLRHSEEAIRQNLTFLGSCKHSCSWLIVDEGYATGYIVAYPSMSRREQLGLPGETDVVIYIADLFIEPGRAGDLFTLFTKVRESITQLNLRHLPLEGICRRSAERILSDHPKVLNRLGYAFEIRHDYWDPNLGEEMAFMRFASLQQRRMGASDMLALSEEFLEEVSEYSGAWNVGSWLEE